LNDIADIRRARGPVSRICHLRSESFDVELGSFDLPQAGDRHTQPERFLDGIEYASKITGNRARRVVPVNVNAGMTVCL